MKSRPSSATGSPAVAVAGRPPNEGPRTRSRAPQDPSPAAGASTRPTAPASSASSVPVPTGSAVSPLRPQATGAGADGSPAAGSRAASAPPIQSCHVTSASPPGPTATAGAFAGCAPETIFTGPKPWPTRPVAPATGPTTPAQPSPRTKPSGQTTAASPASLTATAGTSSKRTVLGSAAGAANGPPGARRATRTVLVVWSALRSAHATTAPPSPAASCTPRTGRALWPSVSSVQPAAAGARVAARTPL